MEIWHHITQIFLKTNFEKFKNNVRFSEDKSARYLSYPTSSSVEKFQIVLCHSATGDIPCRTYLYISILIKHIVGLSVCLSVCLSGLISAV